MITRVAIAIARAIEISAMNIREQYANETTTRDVIDISTRAQVKLYFQ